MKYLIQGGRVIDPANKIDKKADVLVENGKIAAVGKNLSAEGAEVILAEGKVVVPDGGRILFGISGIDSVHARAL